MIQHYDDRGSSTGAWLREMITIEGDVEVDSLEFVSSLPPRFDCASTASARGEVESA